MARRKKKKSKRVKSSEPRQTSPFWRQAFAFILVVFGLFLLIGSVGWGGLLPQRLFDAAAFLFGYGAYFTPLIVVYLAVLKFQHEDNIIPFSKIASSLFMLSALGGALHVFASRTNSFEVGKSGDYGGIVGHYVSTFFLNFLSSATASVLLLVLMLIGFMFTFGIAPKSFIAWIASLLFSRKGEGDETELAALKAKADDRGFKLHEGVPVEHHVGRAPAMSSLKNSMKATPIEDSRAALTTASDPDWQFPGMDLLNQKQDKADAGDVKQNAAIITDTLSNFNIDVEVEGANVGPRVTQYTLKPPSGIKLSKITALESNIALDLAAHSIRMEAPIPGKRAVGIEVPNVKAATVRLSSVFSSEEWVNLKSPLAVAVGKDISGNAVVASLDKMPHILVAGQTGSGKSVMINTLLTSLLYRNTPSDLKLILVDPKRVELAPYNDIPHLLTPVITEPEKCISALKWAVAEMERRYRALAEAKKRNIDEYNQVKLEEGMPFIVIVIDELADLMMMAARDVEALVVRLAQKARAVGLHLVLATQRPSVDVITGLIKANIPARVAFTVASQVDSRTIIDGIGAEKLLGMGDMLFSTAEMPRPKRVQGALITDEETMRVTDFLRMQRAPNYNDEIISQPVQLGKGSIVAEMDDADDDLMRDAVQVVIDARKASTSLLQRRLRIGYGRAARIMEIMEERGIIGPADGSRPREVLVSSVDDVLGGGSNTDSGEVYDDMPDEN